MTFRVFPFAVLCCFALFADDSVVFRSDVSLVRVDVQVMDANNRAVTLLTAKDFAIRDQGKPQEIRNFASENMPVDVLLLLDVSGSMRPHVQKMANASKQAMHVLGKDDRVAMMVFDRASHVKMPFHSSREELDTQFRDLLKREKFNGGTDITRGLLDAAAYVQRNGRKDARRAIIILTDDQTESEFEVDEARVGRALVRADAVLSVLIAPNEMRFGRGQQRGGGQGGRQGGGQRRGGGRGGVIIGLPGGGGQRQPQRGPQGGPQGGSQGGGRGSRTLSAHTTEIALDSGGDSSSVDDSSAFEATLERIRQRYALYFLSPADARPGQERTLSVSLVGAARQRYPNSELRFRKTYYAPESAGSGAGSVTTEPLPAPQVTEVTGRTRTNSRAEAIEAAADSSKPALRRRPAGDGSSGPRGPNPALQEVDKTAVEAPAPVVSVPAAQAAPAEPKSGGWRRVEDPAPATSPAAPKP